MTVAGWIAILTRTLKGRESGPYRLRELEGSLDLASLPNPVSLTACPYLELGDLSEQKAPQLPDRLRRPRVGFSTAHASWPTWAGLGFMGPRPSSWRVMRRG